MRISSMEFGYAIQPKHQHARIVMRNFAVKAKEGKDQVNPGFGRVEIGEGVLKSGLSRGVPFFEAFLKMFYGRKILRKSAQIAFEGLKICLEDLRPIVDLRMWSDH